MKPILTFAALLLFAAPAVGQSHVYTNADIGKKLPRIDSITPERLESLRAHQFVFVPELQGPTSYVIPYDGSRDVMPPLTLQNEPLGEPFGMASYLPYSHLGWSMGRQGSNRMVWSGGHRALSPYRPAPPPPVRQTVGRSRSAGARR